jgi:hypothetical protein
MLFLLLFPLFFCPLLALYVLKFVPYQTTEKLHDFERYRLNRAADKDDDEDNDDEGGEKEIPDFPLDLPPGISLLPKGAPDKSPAPVCA